MNRIVAIVLMLLFSAAPAFAVPLMEKEELQSLLGSDKVVILDVRSGRDWSSSEFKIAGAIRADSGEFDSWSQAYAKDQKIVLYCA